MKRIFTRYIVQEHIFTLTLSALMCLSSILLYQASDLFKLLLYPGVILFALTLMLLISKFTNVSQFLKTHPMKAENCKIIENAVFSEEMVYAYSFKQMTAMSYQEMTLARHIENIHEKIRPGYTGIHKVVLKSKTNEILIPVQNAKIAETILNFIQTKNPEIEFQHKQSAHQPTHLCDLENWSVDGRF